MRGSNSVFKYIFIIFVIGILIFAGYKIYIVPKKDKKDNVDVTVVEETNIIKNLRMGLTNYDTINPLITKNQDILDIDTLIYEPLFTLTKDYKLQPCLARECSKTGSNVYIIKLHSSIFWHDGLPFTAYDVLFTIDLLKKGNSVYKYNVDRIENVQIIDESTIKLTLDNDIPFFEYNLIFPIMSFNYYNGSDFFANNKIPVGTGKYKVMNANTNNITLAKNEKWKNVNGTKELKIESISINIYGSKGEAYNAFKLGNIDLINTSNPNFREYIGTIGFNVTEYPGRKFDFLSFNCEDVILKDSNVRRAISFAIDKTNIISSVFNNNNFVAEYPLDYGNFIYEKNDVSSGFNLEQAKKVLEEGGWIYKYNKWTKSIDGVKRKLSLTLSVDNTKEDRVKVANLIKKQLEEIGIEIKIDAVNHEKYNAYLDNKNYQMLLTGVYNTYSPDLVYYFASGNISNYYNEDMDDLMNKSFIIKDNKQLKEIYKKIYSIYKIDVPFVGLYRNKNISITSESLVGKIEPNNYTTFYDIEDWYRK